MSQSTRTMMLWAMLIMMFVFVYQQVSGAGGRPEKVPISAFIQSVDKGEVGWVRIEGGYVFGLSKDRTTKTVAFTTDKKLLLETLHARRVPYKEEPVSEGNSLGLLINIAFLGLLVFGAMTLMRMMKGGANGAMQFGKSKARLLGASTVTERFADVAGNDEAVAEVQDIVDYLRDPKKSTRLGGRMPKGVLLIGAPGTGKTLLARALAGEAGVPFFYLSGSDFVEMFVGVGASRVRDLFEQGLKNAPCIIFIDEIDAVGKKRATGAMSGGNDEREQTLNALLVEMDGFTANAGVIIMAATNKPESLDPALTRPGRFDRRVLISAGDAIGREKILKIHVRLRRVPVSADLNYEKVAKTTPGLTGADLENLVNEAALLATKEGKDAVETKHFLTSIEKVLMGTERRGRLMSDDEKTVTAWHEAGHAVAGWFSPGADPVHRVSIIPRGMALGYTMQLPEADRYSYRKSQLLGIVRTTLGGRVAEAMILGPDDVTTGASDDLSKATMLVRKMVTKFGLSKAGIRTFGLHSQSFLGEHEERDYCDETARLIDEQIGNIMDVQLAATTALLEQHRDKVRAFAEALLAEETLDDVRIKEILGPRPPETALTKLLTA